MFSPLRHYFCLNALPSNIFMISLLYKTFKLIFIGPILRLQWVCVRVYCLEIARRRELVRNICVIMQSSGGRVHNDHLHIGELKGPVVCQSIKLEAPTKRNDACNTSPQSKAWKLPRELLEWVSVEAEYTWVWCPQQQQNIHPLKQKGFSKDRHTFFSILFLVHLATSLLVGVTYNQGRSSLLSLLGWMPVIWRHPTETVRSVLC